MHLNYFHSTFFCVVGLVLILWKDICRLGILVDFFSHSTITGFMGGTAVILILQQFKGIFGMKHFSTKTNVVAVLEGIFSNRHEVSILYKILMFFFFGLTDQNNKRLITMLNQIFNYHAKSLFFIRVLIFK